MGVVPKVWTEQNAYEAMSEMLKVGAGSGEEAVGGAGIVWRVGSIGGASPNRGSGSAAYFCSLPCTPMKRSTQKTAMRKSPLPKLPKPQRVAVIQLTNKIATHQDQNGGNSSCKAVTRDGEDNVDGEKW